MSLIRGRNKGFSLLEVLIAIVVLTVGLLALAALQGSLTRSSADAKVRSRVAAALTAHMDQLRQEGYDNIDDVPPPPVAAVPDNCVRTNPDSWLDCAAADAGIDSLEVVQNVRIWAGATTFVEQAAGAVVPTNIPQFKRIKLDVSWNDATGGEHKMQLQSDVSSMQLTSNIVVPPEPLASGGGGPIVRTTSPATAGVLPIAMGADSNSATTNPSPELIGSKNNQIVVGTRYSVLNYSAPGFGSSVTIQRRFDQEVVKCTCKYGAGGNNLQEVWRTAQWPAVWNGTAYEVVAPTGNPAAPGQSLASGPKAGVTQSDLCTECCRDHHDIAGSTQTRFDPERNGTTKYDLVGTSLDPTTNTNNGTYINSCRLVRVDGFWRTAADLYARQYGLLETQAVAGKAAKSGLPTSDAITRYTNFVINYLDDYNGTSANAPTNAQTTFTADTAFNAADININPASNTDYRYLHGRGLYVDHLEQKARDKLVEVLADTGPRGLCPTNTPKSECVMPYLPFTTINLTEIAKWTASSTAILTVNSGNLLATDPAQPSGSRTIGKATGTTANNTSMRWSNSGVAINAAMPNVNGVDPDDDTNVYTDAQNFAVNGASGSGFDARISGGGANPFVFFTLGTDVDVECLKPAGSDHHCVVSAVNTMPQSGSLRLSNYWVEDTTNRSVTANCGGTTATATIAVPTFHNYVLSTATAGVLAGSIQPSVNDNKTGETTTVSFSLINANALVLLGFTEQAGSPTYATVTSCTTNGGGNKITVTAWNKPWTVP